MLFVGAGFSHGVTGLDWNQLLEQLRDAVPDSSGWDGMDALDRAQLYVEGRGRADLEQQLAALLPTADALRYQVSDFHRALLSLPFRTIVTTNYDGLVEATLADLDEPFRVVVDDDEVAHAASTNDGCRLVVKMHGDLLLGDTIVLTRDDYLNYEQSRPAMVTLLRSLMLTRTFVFYGFGLQDPNFRLLYHSVLHCRPRPRGRPAYAVMREPNTLLDRYWSERGVELISGNTFGELERHVEDLAASVKRINRENESLDVILGAHFPDEREDVLQLLDEVRRRFSDRLEALEPFVWVSMTPDDLESYSNEHADDVLGAFRVLRGLVRAGLPVDPRALSQAGELLARFGNNEDARDAMEMALRVARRAGATDVPGLRGSLGRVLARLREFDRARIFLERALEEGDVEDVWGRAAELAWLARCVLDRVARLRERRRDRAGAELIASFLQRQSTRLHLAVLEPPEGEGDAAEGEGDVHRWTLYYLNLRLGRIMILASEMAGEEGPVYAGQGIERLRRAIALAPHKPDPYRAIRPLLVEETYGTHDATLWLQLVAEAPKDLQKKLVK